MNFQKLGEDIIPKFGEKNAVPAKNLLSKSQLSWGEIIGRFNEVNKLLKANITLLIFLLIK